MQEVCYTEEQLKKLYEAVERTYLGEDYIIVDSATDFGVDIALAVETLKLTKRGYDRFERLANKVFKTDNLELYTCCDQSGYYYWTKDMNESNYFHINIQYKEGHEGTITQEDEDKLWDILTGIARKYESILYSNTRKKYKLISQ